MKHNYNLLKWEAKYFGYKIASVRPIELESQELKLLINELYITKIKDLN